MECLFKIMKSAAVVVNKVLCVTRSADNLYLDLDYSG